MFFMKRLIFFSTKYNQIKGRDRQYSKKTMTSASLLHTNIAGLLSVQKYKIAPRTARTFIKIRCRPCPADKPSKKSAAPAISQNRKSVAAVTDFERVRCRTTRKKSYKNPAAAPSIREEAAWRS
jgi:hypothetical protein